MKIKQWVSKDPPIYVFIDDCWMRETDKKIFYSDLEKQCWKSEDGEIIPWTKRTRIMKTRGLLDE